MKYAVSFSFIILFLSISAAAQVPVATQVAILKAEDARNFDKTLEAFLSSKDESVRTRAALAAGRIGDEAAIEKLTDLLNNDVSIKVREMAVFALGEIESVKAADTIFGVISDRKQSPDVLGRAVEAAGKIAAANPKDEKAKMLGAAIVDLLVFENAKRSGPYVKVIRAGLTAALRARPEGAEAAIAPFLGYSDVGLVADALNALSRLRAKNSNEKIKELLAKSSDAGVRAGAASALGSAGANDQDSLDLLLVSAIDDTDARVRISAIRSLGRLKDTTAAKALIERGESLLLKRTVVNAPDMNELLELGSAVGTILKDSDNDAAIKWLTACRKADRNRSAEFAAAFAKISPKKYLAEVKPGTFEFSDPWAAVAYAQGLEVLADDKNAELKMDAAIKLTSFVSDMETKVKTADQTKMLMAMPDLLRALAKFKPDNLDEILRSMVTNDDVFIRATAAELIADRPASKENIDALNKAWSKAFITDKIYDDAMLMTLDALVKLDKKEANGALLTSLNSPDYLVRKKAFDLLADADTTASPGIPTLLEHARSKNKDKVLPYTSAFGTKLGQILNSDADYRRAALRQNGKVKAVVKTEKGTFTIDLLPEDAPLTVDNFIKLANAGYFNGLVVHRVVPNFVMQDGDPRGDGNGGPGWSIRCEINMVPYERGAVGMALSGKDTGGSQWFATHSPQPHLDGGYTVFGTINETDMKTVDNIVRGDRIIKVSIVSK